MFLRVGFPCCFPLCKAEVLKIVLKERIFDGFEDDFDVLRVRGTGEVGVEGFMTPNVPLDVHGFNEFFCCVGIILRPCRRVRDQS